MWTNLLLSVISACGTLALWTRRDAPQWLVFSCGLLCLWQLYSALTHPRTCGQVILRLGGYAWTIEDFCRGWLITGETGSGKTLGGINTMLWQVSKNCPNWGGVCVDDKGLYAETLRVMLDRVGRKDDLIVLEVRPEGAPPSW